MAATAIRPVGESKGARRPKSSEDEGKGIWSSMLDNVATGKRLPEKNLLILGGTVDSQKNFLESLSNDTIQRRRPADRSNAKKPPVANRFALGYTYQDVLDADQDDVLARLSTYLLSDVQLAFPSLLQPLLTTKSVPDSAVTILLDWAEPWNWLRQLQRWIRILKGVVDAADNEVAEAMEDNMKQWRQRQKGPPMEASADADIDSTLPVNLGPGEWDEPLGVPLCVVCQNAEKIEILEREHGWKNEEFDTVLMYLRTVLLKHGASLIYTASAAPGSLPTLIRSSLDIHSILQRNPLKHNAHDRDKVLIPPNWDSWGKIRPLQESCPEFDFEEVSNGWSVDIQRPKESPGEGTRAEDSEELVEVDRSVNGEPTRANGSAVASFARLVPDPNKRHNEPIASAANGSEGEDVHCPDNQEFFAKQLEVLKQYKQEDEQAQKATDMRKPTASPVPGVREGQAGDGNRVSEHIGPVQFNMGGIQVDADEMLQSLKEREAGRSSEDNSFVASPDGKSENESLRSFFASLASRGGSSATNSPR